MTGGTRRFAGNTPRAAVYPSIERDGLGGSATAWFDFGNSLDMGRAVDLEYAGRYHLPHESVKLHVFRVARDALLPCPTSTRACRFGSRFHGAWDVSEHRDIPTVTTMPHGHRADPRLWGYVNLADPDSPFKPNATAHEMEWDVTTQRERHGRENQVPEQLPGQTDGRLLPERVATRRGERPRRAGRRRRRVRAHRKGIDALLRVPDSKINDIAAIISESKGLVALYVVALPGCSFLFIAYAGVVLYVRRGVAGVKKIEDEHATRDATRRTPRASTSIRSRRRHRSDRPSSNPSNDRRAWSRRGDDDAECSTVVVNVGTVARAE